MGEVIQLQGDQRKDVQEFLTDKKDGLELDAKTIKVRIPLVIFCYQAHDFNALLGPRVLNPSHIVSLRQDLHLRGSVTKSRKIDVDVLPSLLLLAALALFTMFLMGWSHMSSNNQ
jgi:hypothetical protein